MAAGAAIGLMYLIGLVVAYAIYRGRNAPMITVVPSRTWKTACLIGGLVGLAFIVVFVAVVS